MNKSRSKLPRVMKNDCPVCWGELEITRIDTTTYQGIEATYTQCQSNEAHKWVSYRLIDLGH